MSVSLENIVQYSELWSYWGVLLVTVLLEGQSPTVAPHLPNRVSSERSITFLATDKENFPLALCQPLVLLASFLALVALDCLLSHQIPEQHAEHRVRSQAEKDRTHAFVQAQHAFSLAHLQHAVGEAVVQTALKEREVGFTLGSTISAVWI